MLKGLVGAWGADPPGVMLRVADEASHERFVRVLNAFAADGTDTVGFIDWEKPCRSRSVDRVDLLGREADDDHVFVCLHGSAEHGGAAAFKAPDVRAEKEVVLEITHFGVASCL